jgi:carbonic anhydrase
MMPFANIAGSIGQPTGAAALGCALAVMAATALAEEPAHWSYRGNAGPSHWGALEHEFESCSLGKHQSPIDIKHAAVKKANLDAIKFEYKPSALKIIDNGHTVQVNYDTGSTITVGAKQYELVQFHFHRPSEEKIDGKAADMVVHLVHKNSDGKLAVVAVLVHSGHANPLIETLWKHLPTEKGKEQVVADTQIDAAALLPANRAYYTFTGSLTTPPCSEDVTWFVLRNPTQFSHQEVARFAKIYPMNARPVQPLNGRLVQTSP